MTPPRRGRFITFEGGEGGGKSTQIKRLAEWLEARGIAVTTTREPGGTEGAERIRALLVAGEVAAWQPMSEALLHYAARADHVARVVAPALASGRWVLCDRFADSTVAYQGYGHGLGRARIVRLHALVLGRFKPDLTFIFDLAVDKGLARAASRAGDETRYERMAASFHARVRRGFRAIARAEPRRCVLLDAGQDIETIGRAVQAALVRRRWIGA
ncbi:MAG: dTMP kinase [Alphaproteobacteria bacterium]|nr:dTMP kinase [Alphaproteobacteria bacterium]